ncbi:hypothetical protein DYBT9623_00955 [Dyadobacter sp. CECT 9623]|uniref:Uncharacterized protein n=2 Tax=Dyadobacter linearis TaxID=2823330 RepID=A0ABM8ULN2_9BACT|nr:hypothetical protein DYBT9623_00955 [Dyadobacter sp. CECT 9623]
MLEIDNREQQDIDYTFQDDSLVNTQNWSADTQPVIDEALNTILVTYRSDLKRFYKLHVRVGLPHKLEATDYVKEIGSAADSVKFYYTEVWQ